MSFRICTIGCGGMATTGHGPSYAKYAAEHPGVELAACCDLVEAKAIRFRDAFGFARHYTDLDAMLAAEEPHAVCLVAPESLTCSLSTHILSKGYPLLMEKPPGRTAAEIDQMIAAADSTGAPSQVAFNRRYTPLMCLLKVMMAQELSPNGIHHVRYDFWRVGRTDADFSLTAIHGVDAARFIAGADYAHVAFHYQELPHLGPTTANILMDCTFTSGATAHLNFLPVSGLSAERAAVFAHNHTFVLELPAWGGFDAPGRLQHFVRGGLRCEVSGGSLPGATEGFVANGFYGENASFFDDVRAGRRPLGDLRSARQSVVVSQCIRERRSEYRPEDWPEPVADM